MVQTVDPASIESGRAAGAPSRGPSTRELLNAVLAENERVNAALEAMTEDRDSWRRQWELYANAWRRELIGKIYHKRHLIDALVKTTRWLVDGYDDWVSETAAIKEHRRLEGIAATIGWTGPLPDDGAGNGTASTTDAGPGPGLTPNPSIKEGGE